MVWRNLFGKERKDDAGTPEPPRHDRGAVDPRAEALARRAEAPAGAPQTPDERRIAGLKRQRVAMLYDIEQGELATSPDNPWTNRIALLGETLETVAADLRRAGRIEPGLFHPVPPTPIHIDRVEAGATSVVELSAGGERFLWAEEPDWAERGHQIARPELTHRAGDAGPLVPEDTPAHLRQPLQAHLHDSLLVLATDLRDRALDGESLPEAPTLADLARPCPACGGWTDWRGTCQACARRSAALTALKREEARLLDERNAAADERHKLVEGLPLARRRLRDVETELARLGAPVD